MTRRIVARPLTAAAFAPFGQVIEAAGAPDRIINAGRCVSCGLCGKLCPKSAIEDDSGTRCPKVPKAQWKKPRVDTAACVGCSLCIENCPGNCLELSQPRFHGDIRIFSKLVRPEDCIGCGICVRSCPIRAIELWEVRA